MSKVNHAKHLSINNLIDKESIVKVYSIDIDAKSQLISIIIF